MTDETRPDETRPDQTGPDETRPDETGADQTPLPPARRSLGRLASLILLHTTWVVLLLVAVLVGCAAWYASTPRFAAVVRGRVISQLQDSIGGRIELRNLRWSILHLTVYADGLTIRGAEAADQAPYLHADRIEIGIRIVSFFSPKISLSLLRVEQPLIHLIVYKDGSTNQPTPRTPSTTSIATIFDLAAQRVELVNGVALLNQTALPFSLAARDVNALVTYKPPTAGNGTDDKYMLALASNDLTSRMGQQPGVHSRLNLHLVMGRNEANLQQLTWETGISESGSSETGISGAAAVGKALHLPVFGGRAVGAAQSRLEASASVTDFAHPAWQAAAKGSLDLRQLGDLVGVEGFSSGVAILNMKGRSCAANEVVKAAETAKKPIGGKSTKLPSVDELCGEAYAVEASAELRGAAFQNPYVDLKGVDVKTKVRLTPTFLILTEATGGIEGGGKASGQLHITNWMSVSGPQVPPLTAPPAKGMRLAQASAPPMPAMHAVLEAQVEQMPLRTVMQVVSPKEYQELGFDTAGTGKVHLEWGSTPASVQAEAQMQLAPTGATPPGARSPGVPVTGAVHASYEGRGETVLVDTMTAKTLASSIDASGVVGVAGGDGKTDLRIDLLTSDLGEFNQLLLALGLEANGKKGVQAIPVQLHGSAQFHGTAVGGLHTLDVKGHLEAHQFDALLDDFLPAPAAPSSAPSETAVPAATPAILTTSAPAKSAPAATPVVDASPAAAPQPAAPAAVPQPAASPTSAALAGTPRSLKLDSIVADAEYSPGGLTVRTAVLQGGGATFDVSGTLRPRRIYSKTSWPAYTWDKQAALDAEFRTSHANLGELLHLAEVDLPVSGALDAQGSVSGTLADLKGSGNLTLLGGEAYGEPYKSLTVDLAILGKQIEASRFVFTLPAGQISGNGGYNLDSEKVRAHVDGKLDLPKLEAIKSGKVDIAGKLTLTADAAGTLKEPGLKANVQLTGLTLGGEAMGALSADLHSQASTLYFTSTSNLVGAKLEAAGQTRLSGNYDTQAKLTFTGLDIDSLLKIYAPEGITGHSSIGGTATLDGPLSLPKRLNGAIDLNHFDVQLSGVDLKAAEPLRMSVHRGVLRIDQMHITGQDTDLRASGTANLLDSKKGLNVHAEGSLNMALAQNLDTDILATGRVNLSVDATGALRQPDLGGKVQFTKVNISLQDLANGLSDVNGTLSFDQDRLEVVKLTGMTGGGQLQLGGFIGFHNGLYADLTAKGNGVRIRYPAGVSSTANADLRLQGTQASSLLSGTVLLTKFGLGPNFDAAGLAGSAGGLTAPPDPNAPSSHILLDVHITSAPQLDFQNSYAKLAGDVDLHIRGTVSAPSVLGKITITDGSANFAGTKYQLQRGDIYFTNPVHIEPIIDLDATARVRDYDLTIGLHGPANNLKPTYRSEPPLAESDIFALLALGRTQEEASIYSQQEAAAGSDATTNALLGGALNATVSNRVQKLFGVGSVRVDPSFVGTLGNSAARITVEEGIGKNVTLTYATNVNATAEQLIQMEWDLTRTVSIVAVRDETGVFSMVLKIRKLYK